MRTRPRLEALGLYALVMGVMGIGTVGTAQAQTGACWGYKSGAALPCFSTTLEAQPIITIETSATLLLANLNLEIKCRQATVSEGGTLTSNGSILLGRLEFFLCESYSKKPTLTLLPLCTPEDPVGGFATIRTEKGTGLIVLHGSQPVLELKPDSGTTLVKIFLGAECGVAEEIIVSGKLILQDTGGKAAFETHATSHLIQEFTGLQLMNVFSLQATIDGTANITLASPHNALQWAGKAA